MTAPLACSLAWMCGSSGSAKTSTGVAPRVSLPMAERGVIDLGGFDIEGGHGREAGKAHARRGKPLCKSYNRRPIRSFHSSGICTSRSRGILNSTGGPDGKQADARVRWRMTASIAPGARCSTTFSKDTHLRHGNPAVRARKQAELTWLSSRRRVPLPARSGEAEGPRGSPGGAVRTPRTKKFREWPTDL
jgi:hypothetical protein